MSSSTKSSFFDSQVLGHPAGLFVLFFTEMWERFSFYGMRILLINFLTMTLVGYNPGWEWSAENAGALFGTYAMLLYLTPILGGIIADKYTGYRWAVVIGSIIMTLGHVSMAFETELSLYVGLGLLVIGTGFFKPTMTSIVSEMYKDLPEKKDGAYTIFYMGVNAGAFFGMMLCGYLAEKIGWSWGFGLAGVFMLLGTLQFWLAKPLFGSIGDAPKKGAKHEVEGVQEPSGEVDDLPNSDTEKEEKPNPFTLIDKILTVISVIIAVAYAFNDPISKIGGFDMFSAFRIGSVEGQYVVVLIGLALFLYLIGSRIKRYTKIVRDRMIAFIIFAFFTVFFWLSFEQGATSLVIFARDNVNRILSGNSALIYNVVNTFITVIPLLIISYVLFLLWKRTFKKIPGSNIVLVICFLGMWGVIGWMLNREFKSTAYNVSYQTIQTNFTPESYNLAKERKEATKEKLLGGEFLLSVENKGQKKNISISIDSIGYNNGILKLEKSKKYDKKEKEQEQEKFNKDFSNKVFAIQNTDKAVVYYHTQKEKKKAVKTSLSNLFFKTPITVDSKRTEGDVIVMDTTSIIEPYTFKKGEEIKITAKDDKGETFGYLNNERLKRSEKLAKNLDRDSGIITGSIAKVKENEVEITVSWFSILNSFFIIAFASIFSKWWDSKYNPSAAMKYGLGLIIMAIGFGLLAFGSSGMVEGVKVSMIWLILAYLFHTLGELCLSPVGLSYVSKLVPARMIAFMFGMWYLAIAIGNKLAAVLGGQIDNITEEYSMSTFFLIFTIIPAVAGVLVIFAGPLLKRLMHGVK